VLLVLLRASANMANTRVHYFSLLLLLLFFLMLAVSPAKPAKPGELAKPVSPDSRSRFKNGARF